MIDVKCKSEDSNCTFHIHICGQVQGVGFRPYVFRLASLFLLRGTVCNASDGVHIEFNTDETTAHDFYKMLLENAPILSKITVSSIEKIDFKAFNEFKISHSAADKKANLLLTPDFALCNDCRKELKDPQNHRFEYPFITCIHCGPRYSIINKLPYDRENTTMAGFKMCSTCESEYNNVYDRRYYSQTNSCKICGIELKTLQQQLDASLKLCSLPISFYSKTKDIVSETKGIVSETKGIVSETKDIVSETKGFVSETKGIVSETKGIVAETKGIVAETKGIVSETKGIVSETKGFVSETKGIVAETKGIVAEKRDVGNEQSVKLESSLETNLATIIAAINDGKIIAIKGIGGYLLMCDATNSEAITTLRERKHRPTKPFALLFSSINSLEKEVILRDAEIKALQSPQAPIVLLTIKNKGTTSIPLPLIAPNLSQIGVMLPYTPLFEQITEGVGKPLIATSGNISGSPIIFEDDKAVEYLSNIADLIVSSNRDIVVPQDDSVIKYTEYDEKQIIIRRSRGFAPTFLLEHHQKTSTHNPSILSLGALLKSTFSWQHQGNIYVSQYLGDLENFDTQQSFEHTLNHFLRLFNDMPQQIITDKHPHYFSTQLGERLSKEWNIPVHKMQHHTAHFAAVMAENGLLQAEEPILGVIWDGTGLGDDGHIWGGEFFKYHKNAYVRCYHFDYFPFILGDKMPREPRISALSLAYDVVGSEDFLRKKFSHTEGVLYQKMLRQEGVLQTSSVGRLFDGVASLLDLADKVSYEGEAALLLEALATQFFRKNGLDFNESYISEGTSYYRIPTKTLIQNIVFDLKKGKDKALIAAKFHVSLIKIIQKVAINVGCQKLAFSGGVFQNSLLIDLIIHHLGKKFEVFFHQQLSPNDENISFGQLFFKK